MPLEDIEYGLKNYGNKEHLKLMILLVEKILKSDKVVQSVNDYGEK